MISPAHLHVHRVLLYSLDMSNTTQTPVAECVHCAKGIRQNRAGIWGACKRDDPHPWYCDANPDAGKRHEPAKEA